MTSSINPLNSAKSLGRNDVTLSGLAWPLSICFKMVAARWAPVAAEVEFWASLESNFSGWNTL